MNIDKHSRCLVPFTLVLLLMFSPLCQSSVVRLFGDVYFYEFTVKNSPADAVIKILNGNFNQSFAFVLNGSGKCSKNVEKISSSTWSDKEQNRLMLNSEVLIYSNHEQALSFIVDINFNYVKHDNLKGFELFFELDNKRTSCIQIEPRKDMIFQNWDTILRLKIKDPGPGFRSTSNSKFTYYFGSLTLRGLFNCEKERDMLCHADIASASKEVGIKKRTTTDTSVYKSPTLNKNICSGEILFESCVIRNKFDGHGIFYILMQPLPDGFESIDAEYADERLHCTVYMCAKPVISHNLKLKEIDRFDNKVVVRLFKREGSKFEYYSTFNGSNWKNRCDKNPAGYCMCQDNFSCKNCIGKLSWYKPEFIGNFIEDIIGRVSIKSDNQDRSNSCKNDFYDAFDFSDIKMESIFQNRNLSEKNFDSIVSINNLDLMPRLCVKIESSDMPGFYNLELLFNDYNGLAQSSLIKNRYTMRIFKYEFEHKGFDANHNKKFEVKLPFIDALEGKIIEVDKLDQIIIIKNLIFGNYFIELTTSQESNTLCAKDECIDEATVTDGAKKYQCTKCVKLITRLDIGKEILVEPIDCLTFKALFGSKKTTFETKNLNLDGQKYSFTCLESRNVNGLNEKSPNLPKDFSLEYGFILPSLINTSTLKFPHDMRNWPTYEPSCGIYWNNCIALTIAITMSVILLFSGIYAFRNFKTTMFSQSKHVIFYLSIHLNQADQEFLKKITQKYVDALKKSFKNVTFDILGYEITNKLCTCQIMNEESELKNSNCFNSCFTRQHIRRSDESQSLAQNADHSNHTNIDPFKKRTEQLKKAELIFYICGTSEDVYNLQRNKPILGRNEYHHEHNRIHYVPSISNKTVNATFNMNVKEINKIARNGCVILPKESDVIFLYLLSNRSKDSEKCVHTLKGEFKNGMAHFKKVFVYLCVKIFKLQLKIDKSLKNKVSMHKYVENQPENFICQYRLVDY